MQVTHLGHAAVLAELGGVRILIDPGNFSVGWHGLHDLDAVLITHAHPDHVDPDHVATLLASNPDAAVYAEPGVLSAVDLAGRAKPLRAGDQVQIGPGQTGPGQTDPKQTDPKQGSVQVAAVGGMHAVIHPDLPGLGNVGFVLSSPGEPTLFHPGDALTAVPDGVDVLAVPLMGPWAAMRETVEFVRAVGAADGFGIHDELLSDRGRTLLRNRMGELTPTVMHDLRDGRPHQFQRQL